MKRRPDPDPVPRADGAIDAEQLASLIDGRLDAGRREALIARLARDEDVREALADAAAVLAGLEAEGAHADFLAPPGSAESTAAHPETERYAGPMDRRLAIRATRPTTWLALAALVAALTALPFLLRDTRTPSSAVAEYALLLEDRAAGLPDGWDARPWGATRSAADPMTAGARATRVGARLAALRVALDARDVVAADLAVDLAIMLDGLVGAGPIASGYRDVARMVTEDPALASRETVLLRPAAMEAVGTRRASDGEFLETARIAALRGDVAFFRARAAHSALDSLAVSNAEQVDAASHVWRIRQALDRPVPDLASVHHEVRSLLAALGG
jgi:hypothetical protein